MRSKNLSTPEQAALIGVLAGYTFNNLFVFDNLISLMYFYGLLAFVHSMSKRELPGHVFFSRPGNDQMVAVVAPIVIVLVGGLGWMFNAPAISRATTLIDALQPQNPKTGVAYTNEDHLASFEKALSFGELGRQETVEQLYQYVSNSIAPSTSVSPDTKQKAFTLAKNAGEVLMLQRKDDARLELFTGVFYGQFGQYTDSLAALNKALEHSPNKQQILFQTGVIYLQQGNNEQALTLFKKAFDLEPSYPDARILYATGLYYSGKSGDADKLLTDGFGTVLYDDARLLQTYLGLKMYDRVIAIWNKRVEAAPKDTNVLMGLASVYFQMGKTAETIATLRKVEEIDPSTKTELDSVISQIQNGTLKPQQ
jgi:tetratricopeptide (TPR) repeat protein